MLVDTQGCGGVTMVQLTTIRPSSARSELDCSPLPAADRFDAWTDAVSRSFVPLSALADRESRGHFDGRLVSQEFGSTQMAAVAGSAVTVSRSDADIASADPGHIKLGLQLRGYSVISQDGRDAALAPGDFALYDTTRPYTLDFDDTFRMFVVMFPVSSIRMDHDRTRALTASRFSGRQGLGAIMSRFLFAVSDQLQEDSLTGRIELSDAVFDLLTATVAERVDLLESSDDRSQRNALLLRVEAYIAAHLSDPHLSVASIAEAHHVSVRYLQKLFEEHQQTPSGAIRHRRLDQSRRDLADPHQPDQQIAAVGARWGFADATAYARAFRQEFGVTPSEYRAASRPPGS
jgi:AraC-like DNA-binding protein